MILQRTSRPLSLSRFELTIISTVYWITVMTLLALTLRLAITRDFFVRDRDDDLINHVQHKGPGGLQAHGLFPEVLYLTGKPFYRNRAPLLLVEMSCRCSNSGTAVRLRRKILLGEYRCRGSTLHARSLGNSLTNRELSRCPRKDSGTSHG